MLKDQKIT